MDAVPGLTESEPEADDESMNAATGGSPLRLVVALLASVWLAAVVADAALGLGVGDPLVALAQLGAVAAILVRGVRGPERDRLAWLLIGIAFALWTVGEIVQVGVPTATTAATRRSQTASTPSSTSCCTPARAS